MKSEVNSFISLYWGKVSGLILFGVDARQRQMEVRRQVLAGLNLLTLTLLGTKSPIWLLFLKHKHYQWMQIKLR